MSSDLKEPLADSVEVLGQNAGNAHSADLLHTVYCYRCQRAFRTQDEWAEYCDSCNRITIPKDLFDWLLEYANDLHGEFAWHKDEPRCNYQRDFERRTKHIEQASAINAEFMKADSVGQTQRGSIPPPLSPNPDSAS